MDIAGPIIEAVVPRGKVATGIIRAITDYKKKVYYQLLHLILTQQARKVRFPSFFLEKAHLNW